VTSRFLGSGLFLFAPLTVMVTVMFAGGTIAQQDLGPAKNAVGAPPETQGDGLCRRWQAPERVGYLESKHINEASGLAVSKKYPRLYHINDSGDDGTFYITKRDGSDTRPISIKGFKPRDVEDLSLGPCGDRICLVIADIGDNRLKRKSIEVVLIEEQAAFEAKVQPLRHIKLRYPDGRPHNAEAIAIHPSGDLILVTKEMNEKKRAGPARVFRLPKKELERDDKQARALEPAGEIDFPAVTGSTGYEGLATSMSISPSGNRVLVLTYEKVVEIAWNFAKGPIPTTRTLLESGAISIIPVTRLNQQEGISYDLNGRDFLYDTEALSVLGVSVGTQAELMSVKCLAH
jgi:hypothetical protein